VILAKELFLRVDGKTAVTGYELNTVKSKRVVCTRERMILFTAILAIVSSATCQTVESALVWVARDLGGSTMSSAVSIVDSDPNEAASVCFEGPNQHLWMERLTYNMGAFAPVDLGGTGLTSAPSAVGNSRHKYDVFYRGPNNHLWTSWWPDKPGSQWWSAPTDLAGVALAAAPSAVGGARHIIDVFYKGPNNHLWTSWWPDKPNSQWWSAPTDLGGVDLASAPSVARIGYTGGDWLQVYYIGQNNHLWLSGWLVAPGSGPWWSPPYDLNVSPTSDIEATYNEQVYYRGPNGHLWVITEIDNSPQPTAAPTITSFIASPNNGYVNVGQPVILKWMVANCSSGCNVTLTGHDGINYQDLLSNNPHLPATGSSTVTPKRSTLTRYTLEASNSGGSVSKDIIVQLYGGSPPGESIFYFKMSNPDGIIPCWSSPCRYPNDRLVFAG
jgi:hypothetical protein